MFNTLTNTLKTRHAFFVFFYKKQNFYNDNGED